MKNNEARIKKIKSFTDLVVWQEAHKLVVDIYKITLDFPKTEIFGLTSQIRRASLSVSSNIAEGFSRSTYKEKVQFYHISQGSLTEVQNQLLLARDVGYLENKDFSRIAEDTISVHKLLTGIIKKSQEKMT